LAGVNVGGGTRGQFEAIALVRWQLFVNSLRSIAGRLELAARAVMFLGFAVLGFAGCAGLGLGAWYLTSHGKAAVLAGLFWPVFLLWQLFPIVATAFSENVDSSNLLRFPLSFRSYFFVRVVFGSFEPASAVGILWSLGILTGVVAALPSLVFAAAPVILAFMALNVLLGRMIYAWVERWLAQRRTRELLGILFFIFLISFQFLGPLIGHFGERSAPAITQFSAQALTIQRFSPPGLAADSIAAAFHGDYSRSMASFAIEVFYAGVVVWLLNLRLRAQFRGENLGESAARAARPTGGQPAAAGWDLPGVPGPISAIVEKEFHYLSRSGPMLFTFLMPVMILLIFRFGAGKGGASDGILARATDLAFPVGAAYTLLILTNLVYNSLGGDAFGVQMFFLVPVRFREILVGKNLAHSLVMAIEIILVWVATCLLYHRPSAAITLATMGGMAFALLVTLSAGDLMSMYSPKKIDYAVFGRQRASGAAALASIGIQAAVLGLCALALMVARAQGRIWIATVIFVFLAALAAACYAMVLDRVDAVALERRETIITELSRA
jgi:ABC-2 type transport system permease protein